MKKARSKSKSNSKSKSKSTCTPKLTSTSINVDEVRSIIQRQTKPSLSNVKLTVEKGHIYFGTNWRLSFRDLNRGILSQIDHLLDSCDTLDPSNSNSNSNSSSSNSNNNSNKDIYYEDEYDGGERELTFRSIDNTKKFHCTFHLPTASSTPTLPPSIRSREVQNFVSFLKRFQKLYDKWESKHFPTNSNMDMDMDMDSATGEGIGMGMSMRMSTYSGDNNNLRSYGRLANSHRSKNSISHNRHSYSGQKRLSSLSTMEYANQWSNKPHQSSYQSSLTSTSKSKSRKQKTYGKKKTISALNRKTMGAFDDDDDDYDHDYGRNSNGKENHHVVKNEMNMNMNMDIDVDNGSALLEEDDNDNSNQSVPNVCALNDDDDNCSNDNGNGVCEMEEERVREDEHKNEMNRNTTRKKRIQRGASSTSTGTRRLKKLRTEQANDNGCDSDSDIDFAESVDFTSTDSGTGRTSSGKAIVDDDEDDSNNKHEGKNVGTSSSSSNNDGENIDEDNRNDDDSDAIRPTNSADSNNVETNLTKHFFSKPTTVTVSPLCGNNSKKDKISAKKDILSDPVTDDEDDGEKEETKTTLSRKVDRMDSSENKGSIENFFKVTSSSTSSSSVSKKTKTGDRVNKSDISPSTPPRSDVPELRGDTDSTRTKRSSKYFSKTAQNASIGRADRILNLSFSNNSIVKKLVMSPTETVSDKQASYSVYEQQKSPISCKIITNPYKSSPQENSRHIGLKNRGNTCYLNSSLQMIFSVPGFVLALQKMYKEFHQVGKDEAMPLTKAFLKVASDVNISLSGGQKKQAADPYDLKEAIDTLTDKFAGYEQRDAHEFASALIDYIHDELIRVTKDQKVSLPTDDYFRLDVKVCLTCNSCKYTRCKEELYRHLSIELGKNENEDHPWTVNQSLEQFFVPEVREIRCEECDVGTTATQTIQVMSRPKALLLHLKRFIVSEATMSFRKNRDRIICGESISLDKFCDNSLKNKDKESYNLRGVVRHIGGTASSGHYTADCERICEETEGSQNKKEWVAFNDGVAKSTKLEEVLQKNEKSAYMIMYGM